MTVGSLVVYEIAEPEYGEAVASTMLLTTLSLFHLAGGLLARDQLNTILDRSAIPGTIQLRRYGIALLAIVAVTALGFLQRIFSTVSLSFSQWWICIGIAGKARSTDWRRESDSGNVGMRTDMACDLRNLGFLKDGPRRVDRTRSYEGGVSDGAT